MFSFLVVEAQTIFGIKAAYGSVQTRTESRYIANSFNAVEYQLIHQNASPSFAMGVFSMTDFGWLYLQNEISYAKFQTDFQLNSFSISDEGSGTLFFTETNQYLDISVMSGITVNDIRYGVGPMFHLLGTVDTKLEDFSFYQKNIRFITYGFQGGIGYDYGRLHFDLRYEATFRTPGDHIKILDGRDISFNNKIQLLSLHIGVSIF